MSNSTPTLFSSEAPMPPSVGVMIGKKYGRRTIESFAGWRYFPRGKRHPLVVCLCECGIRTTNDASAIRSGGSKSCGCLSVDRCRATMTTHGHSAGGHCSKTYESWSKALARCQNPNDKGYCNYGGRGIRVCERWRSFASFLQDMGEVPTGLMLERIDNDAGYSCGHCTECVSKNWGANCKWATRQEQNRNRRSTIFIDVGGVKMTASEAAILHGLKPATVHNRLRKGDSHEYALRKVAK